MKVSKRLPAFLLALVMLLSLAACGGKNQQSSAETSPSGSASTDPAGSGDSEGWKPSEPVHIVGQSEAGSGPDLFIRALQPYLQEELGVAVVVENAPGSGGKIAATQIWKAKADGYNLLSHSSPLTTVTEISKDGEYSVREMKHIISFDTTPYVLIVKKDSPIDSIAALVEASKTQQLSNSNSGIGGAMYLQSMIMKSSLGIDYAEVPFNGSNPCMLAVMNGDVTFSILPYDTAIDNQEEVTILAILADERLEILSEVPTMKELGYEFPAMTTRRGIVAPPDTPDEVVERLILAFDAAVKSEGFQKWVSTSGVSMDVVLGEDYQKIDQQYYDTVMSYKDYLG